MFIIYLFGVIDLFYKICQTSYYTRNTGAALPRHRWSVAIDSE
jgi:hypothetical protein